MSPLTEKLTQVSRRLDRMRGAIRALFVLDGISRLVLAMGLFVAVTFMADWALILPRGVRFVLLAGGLAGLAWIFARRIVHPLRVRITEDDLALLVERRYPGFNDSLISAIQLARSPQETPQGEEADRVNVYNSPELVEALVNNAERAAGETDFMTVIVRKYVTRIVLGAAGVTLLLVSMAAWNPQNCASIYLNRVLGGTLRWPQRTHLKVLDFENYRKVVARGDDLTLAVGYDGVEPGKVYLDYTFETGEQGTERLSPVQVTSPNGREVKRFQHTFMRVSGPFTFIVRGGDDKTPEHSVETLIPPMLESIRLFYSYPSYMRRPDTPPDDPETSGNVVAPYQTKVRFEALCDRNLRSATMTLGREETTDLKLLPDAEGRPRIATGSFTVSEETRGYELRFVNDEGLSNRDPVRFTIKGRPDRAPAIKVRDPQGDEFVSTQCARPLRIDVDDDHGVALIALEHRVAAQEEEKRADWSSLEFTREQNSRDYGEKKIRSNYVLDLGKLGLEPGDHVELRFRAEDYKDIGARNVTRSRVYRLSIVSVTALEKELQDAIERVKQVLRAQKKRQESSWKRSFRFIEKFRDPGALSPAEQGEVRQAALDQNDITSRLDTARRDVSHVKRRGVYNKIFNESAADKLQSAIDELETIVGIAGDAGNPGVSRLAAAGLDQAARVKDEASRTSAFREAQNLQSASAAGIQRAIDFLDRWSSYQEVIRITRELFEKQQNVNEQIKKTGGSK